MQDEIIRMARECGGIADDQTIVLYHEELERFAALVAAHERESCAKLCEEQDGSWWPCKSTGKECAAAIRTRGDKCL